MREIYGSSGRRTRHSSRSGKWVNRGVLLSGYNIWHVSRVVKPAQSGRCGTSGAEHSSLREEGEWCLRSKYIADEEKSVAPHGGPYVTSDMVYNSFRVVYGSSKRGYDTSARIYGVLKSGIWLIEKVTWLIIKVNDMPQRVYIDP